MYSQTVPYTTRAPRDGEVDGTKYNFVTREVFDKMKADCASSICHAMSALVMTVGSDQVAFWSGVKLTAC